MGKVTVSHHRHTLQVVVRGADGRMIGQTTLTATSAKHLSHAVDSGLWKRLAPFQPLQEWTNFMM